MPSLTIVDHPAAAHAALSPIRRQILGMLDEPASATELAARLGLPRQKVHYHITVLERHGLIDLDEVRQQRGFQERRFVRNGSVYLAPDLVEPASHTDAPTDNMSAEAVVAAASDAIRAIGALGARYEQHPTATLAADITFASPDALHRFLHDVATLAARYDQGAAGAGLRMRTTLLTYLSTKPGAAP